MTNDIYIAGAIRTPIGKFGGSLVEFSAVDLGEIAARAALESAGVAPTEIAETLIGHGRQAGCGPNPARQIAVRAGVPESTPAMTVNQACASGLRTIALAVQAAQMGEGEVFLVGGTESMSNTPYLLPRARWGYRLGHGELVDGMYRDGFDCPIAEQRMGRTAENLVEELGITREEQDRYALQSQQRAAGARDRLREELVPIALTDRKGRTTEFASDEHVRGDATLEKLARLPPVFKEGGSVHAGNSSGITDGAAAAIVLTGAAAERLTVQPMARIVAAANVGVEARRMGLGPVRAVQTLLEKTNLTLDDIDLIELNEAFAAQVLACRRELRFDMDKTNLNGGAIALGHPIGCSGTRIAVTLLHEMRRRRARYGIATLCVSGGMGMAVLFERV
ncbi:MAG: acetyl-CoA C-acyltransferase [candidate division Zixibacteria bacterium]|nr:acetyl-CoA C-acyltransferase [candidate division Zixibacteria bacterium]